MKMKSKTTMPHGRKPEFPGIGKDAVTLGVSRYFLWGMLKGIFVSAPLLCRYRKLHPGFKVQKPSPKHNGG